MNPDTTSPTDSQGNRLFRSPALLALVFAGLLWGLVLFLSWLGPSEVQVTAEQFQRLESKKVVAAIAVGADGLHCRLSQRVRIAGLGQDVATEHVFLPRRGEVPNDEARAWSAAGISVTRARPDEGRRRNVAGLLLVGGLLAVGVWHLWSQVRHDRRTGNSPRHRLHQLDADFKAGRIPPEEYHRQVEAISAEL